MRRSPRCVVWACLVVWMIRLSGHRGEAQSISSYQVQEVPCRRSGSCVEENGRISFTLGGTEHEQAYVLRYPKDHGGWNGRLVIGVHGETGARVRYGPAGEVVGTHETQLDDMIGQPALDRGYAYASVERGGFGGRQRALWLLYEFSRVMRERLSQGLGQEPARLYAVGWSTGGTLARYAAEDTLPRFDGAIVIAGVGGNVATVTGVPVVPTIEIVGTEDTAVAERVRAYRDHVQRVSSSNELPRPVDRMRLYEVAGAGHVSSEDDDIFSFEERHVGRASYFAVVQAALELLDRWVTYDVPPPADQVIVPPANIRDG